VAKVKKKSVVAKKVVKVNKKVAKTTNKLPTVANPKDLLKNINKPLTRTQQINYLAEAANLPKKDATLFMNSLEPMISFHLKNLEEISIGGLMKIVVVKKPATKAREGINPFTGQPTIFKAKPAKKVIKIRPLKKVKDMVI
jgi:nucleoid DNA-binding protein